MKKKLPITVIIADDDTEDQFLFKRAINELNEQIVTDHAYNGTELMNTLLKQDVFTRMRDVNPNIIFADLHMPKMNGFEMIQKVRDHAKFNKIPIYVFSSTITEEITSKVISLGASAIYEKPHTFLDLKKLIEKILTHEGLKID